MTVRGDNFVCGFCLRCRHAFLVLFFGLVRGPRFASDLEFAVFLTVHSIFRSHVLLVSSGKWRSNCFCTIYPGQRFYSSWTHYLDLVELRTFAGLFARLVGSKLLIQF